MVVVLWQQKRASASMVSDASLLPAAFALLGILQAAGGHMLEYSFYGDYLLVFVPLSTVSFLTLPGHLRTDGTAMLTLVRNVASSVGISVVIAKLL